MSISESQYRDMVLRVSRNRGREPGPIAEEPQKPVSPEDKLNQTEKEFLMMLRGGIYGRMDWIGIQCLRLRLADSCTYTPDFLTVQPVMQIRLWEVKGAHVWEDGWIKLKMAAHEYPFFTFVKAQKVNGVWTEKIINQ